MSSEKKVITLTTSDGESFEVEEAVAHESVTLKNMLDDIGADNAIPLPNVTGYILGKVIAYCRKHVEDKDSGKEKASDIGTGGTGGESPLKSWDAEFVKVEQSELLEIILAANYLDIKGLLDLTCRTVAGMIQEKTPEEIRALFHIKNDYTPEEEEELRRENQWAFA